jgi:hypothetical protein
MDLEKFETYAVYGFVIIAIFLVAFIGWDMVTNG